MSVTPRLGEALPPDDAVKVTLTPDVYVRLPKRSASPAVTGRAKLAPGAPTCPPPATITSPAAGPGVTWKAGPRAATTPVAPASNWYSPVSVKLKLSNVAMPATAVRVVAPSSFAAGGDASIEIVTGPVK